MAAQPLIDPELWSLDGEVFTQEQIRETNAQRFEMEQLDRVTYFNTDAGEIVGYKDVAGEEFWVRGHIPERPLLPGVLMLEALAQLTSFYIGRAQPDIGFVGFGGVDAVKFRTTVVPGQRLVLVGKSKEIRRRRAVFWTQGWADGRLAVEAVITGVKV